MSQYPPQYPQQQQGFGPQYPPAGYPPGQAPPGYGAPGGPFAIPPQRTSAAAVAAFVFSLLLCIPLLNAVLAFLLGIIGFSATGKPGVKGRGFAVTALVLSILQLLCWGGLGIVYKTLWNKSAVPRQVATKFVADMGNENFADAATISTPDYLKSTVESVISRPTAANTLLADAKLLGKNPAERWWFSMAIDDTQSGSKPTRRAVVWGTVVCSDGVTRNLVVALRQADGGEWLVEGESVKQQ